ncbi:hypothetical protein JCGZ_05229 [Jatropha curcas]|uniref:Uncharacterized protein n=1 Tax=Jatropha curcas TaxID=180498 RepID=A0A067L0Z6_JATCU|nr:hypothetical protein JCGZ_05229 [Jatropha curcas]
MQCPNCRKIEKGQWLYANGCRSLPEFNMDDWAHDEDLYDLSYSEMWRTAYRSDRSVGGGVTRAGAFSGGVGAALRTEERRGEEKEKRERRRKEKETRLKP